LEDVFGNSIVQIPESHATGLVAVCRLHWTVSVTETS